MVNLIVALALSVFSDGFEDRNAVIAFSSGPLAMSCDANFYAQKPPSIAAYCKDGVILECDLIELEILETTRFVFVDIRCIPGTLKAR